MRRRGYQTLPSWRRNRVRLSLPGHRYPVSWPAAHCRPCRWYCHAMTCASFARPGPYSGLPAGWRRRPRPHAICLRTREIPGARVAAQWESTAGSQAVPEAMRIHYQGVARADAQQAHRCSKGAVYAIDSDQTAYEIAYLRQSRLRDLAYRRAARLRLLNALRACFAAVLEAVNAANAVNDVEMGFAFAVLLTPGRRLASLHRNFRRAAQDWASCCGTAVHVEPHRMGAFVKHESGRESELLPRAAIPWTLATWVCRWHG